MKLPTVEDFVCTAKPEDDLDGFCAWKNFGGLTVEEAYEKFCQCSETYQEDFMFMGDAAFVFYFPVIDRYIREEESGYEFDCETHILGQCIDAHVSGKNPLVRPLYDHIVKLCYFVLQGLKGVNTDERRDYSPRELQTVWEALAEKTLNLIQ